MGIDLSGGFATNIDATDASWPKCHRCSTRLGMLYPVEVFGYAGRERPRQIGDKMRIVFDAECHGAKHTFELDHPIWWGESHLHTALGRTFVFVKSGRGEYVTAKIRGGRR